MLGFSLLVGHLLYSGRPGFTTQHWKKWNTLWGKLNEDAVDDLVIHTPACRVWANYVLSNPWWSSCFVSPFFSLAPNTPCGSCFKMKKAEGLSSHCLCPLSVQQSAARPRTVQAPRPVGVISACGHQETNALFSVTLWNTHWGLVSPHSHIDVEGPCSAGREFRDLGPIFCD